ncbi:MAG: carboxypeptidase regulatory-like domain-containing protein [Acidobacteria bacterium]|nr:carboxypeptidase regulatory-like domain-containing protein [Acidobacteriota bacterium]
MTFPKTVLVLFLCSVIVSAAAQESGILLRGTVIDPSSVPIQQATIAIVNFGTGESHSTTSNSQGNFEIGPLSAGEYRGAWQSYLSRL